MSESEERQEPPSTEPLEVRLHGDDEWDIPCTEGLVAQALKVLEAEGATGPVDIVFHSPEEQRALNKEWRKLDRTTDVLSFPYDEPELFGELYIDPLLAREQAQRFQHSFYRELRRLVTHGCLHLCGYDHHTAPERREMRELEDRYDPDGLEGERERE